MTKILLVISKFHPEYTGAAHRIDLMYRRLQQADPALSIDVVCNSTSHMDSDDFSHKGWWVKRRVFPWRCSWLPLRLRNAVKAYWEFFASLGCFVGQKPDLVHIVGFSGGTMAALIYFRWRRISRLIELVTKSASPVQFLPGLRYERALELEKQSVIVAISGELASTCSKIGLRCNVWCRPNPVDASRFFPDAQAQGVLREELTPFQPEDIVIGMVAKSMPQKNQIFLLEVLGKLPDDFKFLLAGPRVSSGIFKSRDERYYDSILENIDRLGLGNRVHIHADFVDASRYMKACDVYVMPQFNEGLGTPMLEAMACGLPVVANQEEPAFNEWITEGDNGFLRPLIAKEWAEVIRKSAAIPIDERMSFSSRIRAIASSTLIDNQYALIIDALKDAQPYDCIDVSLLPTIELYSEM